VAPLMTLDPKDWPIRSERIDLLDRKYIAEDTIAGKALKDFLERDLVVYNESFRYPAKGCLRTDSPAVHVDILNPLLTPLMDAPSSKWSEAAVEALVKELAGRSEIICVDATPGAVDNWFDFLTMWEPYVHAHPDIARRLDPFYVIIDVFGVVAPATLAPAIASYPPVGSTAPALTPGLNGSAYVIPFAALGDARHFVGFIQGRVNGLRAWITSGNITPPARF
jgi:hypothetical protein